MARASCTRKHRREGEEETCLDKCFTVVKYFASLDADSKTRLADCLGSNLSALVRKSALQVRITCTCLLLPFLPLLPPSPREVT